MDLKLSDLTPGNLGKDCLGNGNFKDKNQKPIECQCDECEYLLICIDINFSGKHYKDGDFVDTSKEYTKKIIRDYEKRYEEGKCIDSF